MVSGLTKQHIEINSFYPFLESFPFTNEYDMRLEESQVEPFYFEDDDLMDEPGSSTVFFNYKNGPINIGVSISNDEMWWIHDAAKSIKKLNKIAKLLDKGLKSNDLLVKRDVILESDLWISQLSKNSKSLSLQIFNEALGKMAAGKSIQETVHLVNSINKLYTKNGLIKLSKSDASIIMTFFQFRMIYTKLILGIVIASKISM
jgi:hypothetical protein